jgi:MYXO-CTERM domain-containing protein
MLRTHIALGSLLALAATFVASSAQADTAGGGEACNPSTLKCASGTAALTGKITTQLDSLIDSGWLEKGPIKLRTHFAIAALKGEPLLSVNMPKGALVNAAWVPEEKGSITVRPITEQGAEGTMDVRYTLMPSIQASLWGVSINYDTTELLAKIPGASINYDSRANAKLSPWGFAGADATPPAPALDKSTIFSLSFEEFGLDPGTAEGTLSIQAAAKPVFKYKTKEVMFDSASVGTADGSAKISVADGDFVDVNATVIGELAVAGQLDIRPVVKVDSVAGFPTFGLVKYSFSAVTKDFDGKPTPVTFERTTIHIPLPNVKVPAKAVSIAEGSKSVTIDNTGEMDAVLSFESSDPQFVLPSGDVPVKSKSQYNLDVKFNGASNAPATATITVRSNDPDSPEQTFKIGANGADVGDESDPTGKAKGSDNFESPEPEGCACSTIGSSSSSTANGTGALALVGLGLVLSRRRRSSR